MNFTAQQKKWIKAGRKKTSKSEKARIRKALKKKHGIKRLRRRRIKPSNIFGF